MSDKNIKFGVDFDTKDASAAADELRKKLQALGNVKPASNGVSSIGAQLEGLRSKLDGVKEKFNATFGPALSKSLAVLRTALLAVAAAAAAAVAAISAVMVAGLKKGIANNSELDDLQTGVAATVSSLYELRDATGAPLQGLERFQAAAEQARKRLEQLRKETAQTGYAQKDLAAALDTGLSSGAAAGIDAAAVQSLVADIAHASTAVGVVGADLSREVKALFSGQGLNGSKLGDALAISPQMLQDWKRQGTLVQELNNRLVDLKAVAANAEQGMEQLKGRLSNGLSNALTSATAGAYDTIKKTLSDTLEALFDENGEIAPRFAVLYRWATKLFDVLANTFHAGVSFVLDKLGSISDWLTRHEGAISDIGDSFTSIGRSIKGMLSPLGDVANGLDDAASSGELLVVIFETLERIISAVADVAKAAMGGVGALVGGLGAIISKFGSAVGDKLNLEGLQRASDSLTESSIKMAAGSAQMAKSGLALESSISTAAAIAERQRERTQRVLRSMQVDSPETAAGKPSKAAKPVAENLKSKPVTLTAAELEAAKKAAEAIAAAELAAVRQKFTDEQELLRVELDKRVQLGIVNKRQELAERQKLEVAALDFETKAAQAAKAKVQKELATTLDPLQADALRAEIIKIDTQLASIASKGKVLKVKAELDVAAFEKQVRSMEASLNAQLLQLQGKPEDLAAARVEALKNELVQATPELQNLVNAVFDAKEANQRFEAAAAKADAVHTKLQMAEAAIERQFSDATITMLERETKLRDVRIQSADALKAATDEMKKAADATGNKQLMDQATQAAEAVEVLDHKTRELQQRTVSGLKNEFSSAFSAIASGAKSLSDGLMDLFTSLLGKLAQKFATQGFEQLFAAGGGAGAGGGGGWLGGLLGAFGGAFATGGLIRGPGTGTSDQVPILASNGEFMMRAAVVKKHFSLLNYLNSTGNLPPMRSTGGAIGNLPAMNTGIGGTTENNIHVSPQVIIETGQVIEALSRDPRFERTVVQFAQANKRKIGIS
ncbi:hypothetical protein [Comamonas terrigena]|uniref:hypothetical protein n=1 Tax=Comamonas terrigena TaxID=32013 RepID=UPI0028A22DA6|nr:hypothetical protein [Comamonas terrigena]